MNYVVTYWKIIQKSFNMTIKIKCSFIIILQILVLSYVRLEKKKGFVTSGVLFVYWMLVSSTYVIVCLAKTLKPVSTHFCHKDFNTNTLGVCRLMNSRESLTDGMKPASLLNIFVSDSLEFTHG